MTADRIAKIKKMLDAYMEGRTIFTEMYYETRRNPELTNDQFFADRHELVEEFMEELKDWELFGRLDEIDLMNLTEPKAENSLAH